MEMYLLKSAACLAILMLFYKLLLEKENMHVFKRFYLLGAVLISFIIPWITFTSYVEMQAISSTHFFEVTEAGGDEVSGLNNSFILTVALWTLYGIGVIFFGIKFCRNLQEILRKIKKNPHIKSTNTTNVLLKEEVAPHTFWNYIFLNRVKYYGDQIPVEVFEHEQAHAVQRHSLDILLMELLQVIFWFHPLLYPVKKAIKLNHEFLADRAVIKKGINTSTYQKTLLAFSSGAANSSFVNSINYQSIKKRFTVMKTNTSKSKIWITSLLLLPLMAALLYGFSTTKTVVKEPAGSTFISSAEENSSKTLEISVDEKGIIHVEGKQLTISEIRESLKPEQYTNYAINASPSAPKGVMEELMQVVLTLRVEGSVTVCSSGEDNGKNVMDEIFHNVQDQEKATPQMVAEYNKLAKRYREEQITEVTVQEKDFKRMMYIFGLMTEDQRKNAEKLPPPPPPTRITEDTPPPPPPPVTKDGDVPPPPPPPVPTVEEAGDVPPPPPPPPSPIEAVKDWIEEGATFFYNGKSITPKQALEIVQENNGKNLSVQVQENNTGKTVRLSDNKK